MIPIFNEKDSSTRDKIVAVLAEYPGITTKKINAVLKKQYTLNVTYQAVHKTLKQMVEQEILYVENKLYMLNPKWVDDLNHFVNKIQNKNVDSDVLNSKLTLTDVKRVSLTNLKEFDEFYYNLRNDLVDSLSNLPEKEREIYYHLPHCYYAIAYPTREAELMNKLEKSKTKMFFLTRGKTEIDMYIENFYKDSNAKVLLGIDAANTREIWIFPGVVYEVYYSFRFNELFNKLYDETKDITKIKFQKFLKRIYSIKDPIQIIENRNKLVVDSLIRISKELIKKREQYKTLDSSKFRIPLGSPLDKGTRYYVKQGDHFNKMFNQINYKNVLKLMKTEAKKRDIKEIKYQIFGKFKFKTKSKIVKSNLNELHLIKIEKFSGFFRKKNPATWKFGHHICDMVKKETSSLGFITSDEISSRGGRTLAYGFTRRALKEMVKATNANINEDLIIILAYDKIKSKKIGDFLLKTLSKELDLPLKEISNFYKQN